MNEPQMLSPEAVAAALLGNGAAPTAPAIEPAAETAQPLAPDQPITQTAPAVEPVRDRLGRAFDAKRFRTNPDGSPFLNAKGDFMPRGGRKGGSTAPNAETTAKEPPPISAANPTGPAWSEADRAAAAKSVAPETDAEGKAKTVETEIVGSADDSAEVACRAVYTTLGYLTDAPEEATPTPAEHKNMQAMVAAYFRSRGWLFAGGVAVCIALLAYLLRTANKPKTRETVRGWFRRMKPAPAPEKTAPAPVVPPAPNAPVSSLPRLIER
jgi:hypothetical protein